MQNKLKVSLNILFGVDALQLVVRHRVAIAPPINELLANLFQFLCLQHPSKEGFLPEDTDSIISILLEYLQSTPLFINFGQCRGDSE